ncbi:MAG: inositol monophosphatase family protein [Acetobacteraceae bacterium]
MNPITHRDLGAIAALLREVGRAEIMPRFRRLPPGGVRTKSGPLDFVTDADTAAEAAIAAGLRQLFPAALVVGEEASAADPSLLGGLADAVLAFVVDPVDGTANFAAGLPLFGVMVGVIARGEVVGSVIHDPVLDDRALALRGEGAWTEDADGTRVPLRVADSVSRERMSGHAGWRFAPPPLRARIVGNLPRLGACWDYRCAAHEYRLAASGGCHFLLFHRLMPWDHAAGWLLHREAGGYAARFDGGAYAPTHTGGGLICAPDRASWETVRAALLEE